MGVDISIFNKNKKTVFHAGREKVVRLYNIYDFDQYMLARDLHFRLNNPKIGLNLNDLIKFIEINKNAANTFLVNDEDACTYALYWLDEMQKFAMNNPLDTYFVLHDHDDRYYDPVGEYEKV